MTRPPLQLAGMVESQIGMTYPDLLAVAQRAEGLEFPAL